MKISSSLTIGLALLVVTGCAADRCGCLGKHNRPGVIKRLFSKRSCATQRVRGQACSCVDCTAQANALRTQGSPAMAAPQAPPQPIVDKVLPQRIDFKAVSKSNVTTKPVKAKQVAATKRVQKTKTELEKKAPAVVPVKEKTIVGLPEVVKDSPERPGFIKTPLNPVSVMPVADEPPLSAQTEDNDFQPILSKSEEQSILLDSEVQDNHSVEGEFVVESKLAEDENPVAQEIAKEADDATKKLIEAVRPDVDSAWEPSAEEPFVNNGFSRMKVRAIPAKAIILPAAILPASDDDLQDDKEKLDETPTETEEQVDSKEESYYDHDEELDGPAPAAPDFDLDQRTAVELPAKQPARVVEPEPIVLRAKATQTYQSEVAKESDEVGEMVEVTEEDLTVRSIVEKQPVITPVRPEESTPSVAQSKRTDYSKPVYVATVENYYGLLTNNDGQANFQSLPPLQAAVQDFDSLYVQPLPTLDSLDEPAPRFTLMPKLKAVPNVDETNVPAQNQSYRILERSFTVPENHVLKPIRRSEASDKVDEQVINNDAQHEELPNVGVKPLTTPTTPAVYPTTPGMYAPTERTTPAIPDREFEVDQYHPEPGFQKLPKPDRPDYETSADPWHEGWTAPNTNARTVPMPRISLETEIKQKEFVWREAEPTRILRLKAIQPMENDKPSLARFNLFSPTIVHANERDITPPVIAEQPQPATVDAQSEDTIER